MSLYGSCQAQDQAQDQAHGEGQSLLLITSVTYLEACQVIPAKIEIIDKALTKLASALQKPDVPAWLDTMENPNTADPKFF